MEMFHVIYDYLLEVIFLDCSPQDTYQKVSPTELSCA